MPYEHTKKAPRWGAFFVSALSVLAVVPAQAQCPRLAGGFEARVAHVYDGDTLKLADGRRVRLIGVNTPEMGRDGTPDQPLAQVARRWLEQRIGTGPVYLVPGVEARDRYGRLLAHLYLPDGRLASEELLRQGLGHALAVGRNTRLLACLFAADARAMAEHQGVWASGFQSAGRVAVSGFAAVSGRITRVTSTRSGVYLDLDDHLALLVPSELIEMRDLSWRKGDRIQVRGWVVDRQSGARSLRRGEQRWLLKVSHLRHLQSN